MVDSYRSTKFGINLLDGFRPAGRMTDARATALALLAQSSRAKKVRKVLKQVHLTDWPKKLRPTRTMHI